MVAWQTMSVVYSRSSTLSDSLMPLSTSPSLTQAALASAFFCSSENSSMMSLRLSLPYGPGSTFSFSTLDALTAVGNLSANATTQPVHLPMASSIFTALIKPGIFFASDSSMLSTLEAYRVRGTTNAPYTIPGRNTSMPNFAWPLVLAGMSMAGTDLPMIL